MGKTPFDTCTTCRRAQPTIHSSATIGPFCVRQSYQCEDCASRTPGPDELPVDEEGQLRALGPIDFDDLRESVGWITDTALSVPRGDLAAAAATVVDLARLHGQEIPADIKAFFARIRV